MNIVDIIKSMPDYIGSNGRTEKDIHYAEKILETSFAKDYREYLKEIGLACFDGHEFTGLTKTSRLDVISVTKDQGEQFVDITSSWYVIEKTGIDGIIIWQSSSGELYQTSPTTPKNKIANSLSEYLLQRS